MRRKVDQTALKAQSAASSTRSSARRIAVSQPPFSPPPIALEDLNLTGPLHWTCPHRPRRARHGLRPADEIGNIAVSFAPLFGLRMKGSRV